MATPRQTILTSFGYEEQNTIVSMKNRNRLISVRRMGQGAQQKPGVSRAKHQCPGALAAQPSTVTHRRTILGLPCGVCWGIGKRCWNGSTLRGLRFFFFLIAATSFDFGPIVFSTAQPISDIELSKSASAVTSRVEKLVTQLGGSVEKSGDGAIKSIDLDNRQIQVDTLQLISTDCSLLEKLVIWGPGVTDDGVAALVNCKQLTSLELKNSKITGKGLKHLTALPKINALNLQRSTGLNDAAVVHLSAFENLKYLRMMYTPIGDAGASHLAKCRKIRLLDLRGCNLSDKGASDLATMQSVVALKLRSGAISDASMVAIGKMSSLTGLAIEDSSVSDDGIAHLASLANMQDLNLMRSPVSSDSVAHLAGMKHLKQINLRGTFVGDEGLAHLVELEALFKLDLSETFVGDDGIKYLAKLPKLRWLSLWNSSITDDGLQHLGNSKSLKYLDVRGTLLSQKALSALQTRLPQAKIISDGT